MPRTNEAVTISGDLGLTKEDLQTLIQQQLTHGMPAREVEGAAGIGLYLAGRVFQRVRRGIGAGIKGAIGSVLVIPRETEVAVIKTRRLSQGGAVEYSAGAGLLTRVSEEELSEGIGVRPGAITLKVPILEQAERVEAITLQAVGGKSKVGPELTNIATDLDIGIAGAANFATEREVIDSRGKKDRKVVVDGNPVTTIRLYGSLERALEVINTTVLDSTIGGVFMNEHFRQETQLLLQNNPDEIPTGQISAHVTRAVGPAFSALTEAATGLKVRSSLTSVVVEYPEAIDEFADARIQAAATRIEKGAEAQVAGMQAAQITSGIVQGLGGPEGVATILGALIGGKRNQLSE